VFVEAVGEDALLEPLLWEILRNQFKKEIKESYIISRFGYFKISFNSYIDDLKEFNKFNIDKITSEFYFSTNKGRDYNKDAINKLCKKLYNHINYIIKNKYLISEKFKISFNLY
jgi:hypothetical protein